MRRSAPRSRWPATNSPRPPYRAPGSADRSTGTSPGSPYSPQSVRSRLLVAVLLGEPEAARRCRFGIELDQHRCLVTDDPGIVSGLNDYHLRRDELEGAAVGVLATYVAPGQEADVRIHAKHCADERLQVR